jgi:hypothetical protein
MYVLQIKITLSGIEPIIWRRLRVRADITLEQLHDIVQTAMGWQDMHLHLFSLRGREYGRSDPKLGGSIYNEREAVLGRLVDEGDRFLYVYDFGDDWNHELEIEEEQRVESDARLPRCIGGERACPPEDCGGPPGYAHLLEALADPRHAEHNSLRDWIEGDFDPEAFNTDAVNTDLRGL